MPLVIERRASMARLAPLASAIWNAHTSRASEAHESAVRADWQCTAHLPHKPARSHARGTAIQLERASEALAQWGGQRSAYCSSRRCVAASTAPCEPDGRVRPAHPAATAGGGGG